MMPYPTDVSDSSIPFSGRITRQQFSLVQRMMSPWWGTMSMTVLWTVSAALAYALGDHLLADTGPLVALRSLGWAMALLIIVWIATTSAHNQQWNQTIRSQPVVAGRVGEAGLEWNTPLSAVMYPWSRIAKIIQHPEMLLIFHSEKCAFYISKPFFTSETAWSEANALALRHLPLEATGIKSS